MGDLISREQAIAKIENLNVVSFYELNEHSKEAYSEIMAAIKNMPSAEAEWIESTESRFRPFMCSNCGCIYDVDTVMGKPIWNYCPNCGARMDERKEDGNIY